MFLVLRVGTTVAPNRSLGLNFKFCFFWCPSKGFCIRSCGGFWPPFGCKCPDFNMFRQADVRFRPTGLSLELAQPVCLFFIKSTHVFVCLAGGPQKVRYSNADVCRGSILDRFVPYPRRSQRGHLAEERHFISNACGAFLLGWGMKGPFFCCLGGGLWSGESRKEAKTLSIS